MKFINFSKEHGSLLGNISHSDYERIEYSYSLTDKYALSRRVKDQWQARKLRRANGCVISLLIAPAADLIQPLNRCLGRVLTGDVDNRPS